MNLEENKRNAIAFYKTSYQGNPKLVVEEYLGENTSSTTPMWLMELKVLLIILRGFKRSIPTNPSSLFDALLRAIWLRCTQIKHGLRTIKM